LDWSNPTVLSQYDDYRLKPSTGGGDGDQTRPPADDTNPPMTDQPGKSKTGLFIALGTAIISAILIFKKK
ncbi:MAG: hypothetical protein HRT68_15770, partial [Flavobacteriaceae bacterium]|nr:hypothetical protein [Flavobacteriaceae bacterium]